MGTKGKNSKSIHQLSCEFRCKVSIEYKYFKIASPFDLRMPKM